MGDKSGDLRNYRLTEASEKLDSAKILLDNNRYKDSINRSYYALFDAIRSVLSMDNVDFKHHSQVIGYFNKNYIHTGKFDIKYIAIINSAFQIRNSCDYDDFFIASKTDAEDQYNSAKELWRMRKENQSISFSVGFEAVSVSSIVVPAEPLS